MNAMLKLFRLRSEHKFGQIPLASIIEAQRTAEDERQSCRATLIAEIRKLKDDAAERQAALIARAKPLESVIARLRADLDQALEQVNALASERVSAMYSCNDATKPLEAELREDAKDAVGEFQRAVEATRSEINHNLSGRRSFILGGNNATYGMSFTLEAYNDASRIAVEKADVHSALTELRRRLRDAGITLLDMP